MKTIQKIELKVRRVDLGVAEGAAVYGRRVAEPGDVGELARALCEGEGQELFLVFLLNVRNRVIGYVEAARGGLDACPVDPRVVFRAAVVAGSSAIVVAHNHPSGEVEPSPEDLAFTKRLKAAGELLGIAVLDHVIVTDRDRYSLAEAGRM